VAKKIRERTMQARFTPISVICLLWAVGCVTPNHVHVTDRVDLPELLVSAACEEGHEQNPLVTMDSAEVLVADGVPWGLDCSVYDFAIGDHIRTLVDFRHSTAAVNRIRDYLVANGVRVPQLQGT
jgi:hypothetical protein